MSQHVAERHSRESGKPVSLQLRTRKLEEEDEHDEYYEIDDERPNFEPTERPSDQRGERPTRTQVTSRWGPKGRNSR